MKTTVISLMACYREWVGGRGQVEGMGGSRTQVKPSFNTVSQEKHSAIMESVYAMESIRIAITVVHKQTYVILQNS